MSDSKWLFASAAQPFATVESSSKRAMAALQRAGTCDTAQIPPTKHGLRRTAFVGMRRAGISRDAAAMVLNQELRSGGAATSHYDHYDGDKEKRAMR